MKDRLFAFGVGLAFVPFVQLVFHFIYVFVAGFFGPVWSDGSSAKLPHATTAMACAGLGLAVHVLYRMIADNAKSKNPDGPVSGV